MTTKRLPLRSDVVHRLAILIVWTMGALALAEFLARPSMERNALVFGQSLAKLAVGGLCVLLLVGVSLLGIFYAPALETSRRNLWGISQHEWGPAAIRIALALCVTMSVSVSVVAIGVNLGAPYLDLSGSAVEVGLFRTRFLILWVGLLLLASTVLLLEIAKQVRPRSPSGGEEVAPSGRRGGFSWQIHVLVFVLALAVTAAVWRIAWVSEDSFITFRYVSNALQGYGPVFNVGERVQGYTHPLWYILLLLGTLVFGDPIRVSIGLGLIFTLLMIAALGYAISGVARTRTSLFLILGLCCLTLALSDPWLSFQTGGLENSLANLLISLMLICIWANPPQRPEWIVALACLLCLSRPDFAILVAPVMLVLLGRIRPPGGVFKVALAAFPAVAWLLFAWAYYGTGVPNTAYAKLGIYPNWVEAVQQGLLYLGDWFTYDRVAAWATAIALAIALFGANTKERIASVVGVVLYAGWVVWIGGDFMRGRFMIPVFVAAVVLAALTLAEIRVGKGTTGRVVGLAAAASYGIVALLVWTRTPDPGAKSSPAGIVNERVFYHPGYTLHYISEVGIPERRGFDMAFALDLRRYGEECGPIVIDSSNPGTIAYLAGPKISVIDTLGLTDAYIARLPQEFLVDSHPRPGHPVKEIPIAYLMSRKDISLLPNWRDAVQLGDCSLTEQLSSFVSPVGDPP